MEEEQWHILVPYGVLQSAKMGTAEAAGEEVDSLLTAQEVWYTRTTEREKGGSWGMSCCPPRTPPAGGTQYVNANQNGGWFCPYLGWRLVTQLTVSLTSCSSMMAQMPSIVEAEKKADLPMSLSLRQAFSETPSLKNDKVAVCRG